MKPGVMIIKAISDTTLENITAFEQGRQSGNEIEV